MISRPVGLILTIALVTLGAIWVVVPLIQVVSPDPLSDLWVILTVLLACVGFGLIAVIPWIKAAPIRTLAAELNSEDLAKYVRPVRVADESAVVVGDASGIRIVNLSGFDRHVAWSDVTDLVTEEAQQKPGLGIRLTTSDASTLLFVPLDASATNAARKSEVTEVARRLRALRS